MCKQCYKLAKKYYPELRDSDLGELLWGATAFPFGGPDIVGRQLAESRRNTDGTLRAALIYANNLMFEEGEIHDFELSYGGT